MSGAGHPAWDDPALTDPSDSPRRALYRRKQSWYREVVLGVPPGRDAGGRVVGSLLDADAVAGHPGLAFIEDASGYVDVRLAQIPPTRPPIDVDSLRRDLLSPTGVAFNLLATLRGHPRAAVRVMRSAFGVDAASLQGLDVEPDPPSGESGWLDALAVYCTPGGRLGFVGIVARYADQPPRLDAGTALEHHGAARLGSASVRDLAAVGAVDLWAAATEVAVLLERSPAVAGHLAVLASADDAATWKAVDILRADPAARAPVRAISYEEVLGSVIQRDGLSGWADAFAARYLDLSVVS